MIVILGAGIAGLSLAHEIVNSREQVTVIDAGDIASGASGVATSYLEPRLGDTPMRKMEREALFRWDDYASNLEQHSRLDVEFRREGQLRVTLAEYEQKLEKDLAARQNQDGVFNRLTAKQVFALEPELSRNIVAGAYLSDVRWVAGRLICEALAKLLREAGTTFKLHQKVVRINQTADILRAKLQDGTDIEADKIVLCTGMGANEMLGLPDDIPKSRPVRGVNLVTDMSGLTQPISHLIKHHRGNLVPRSNGRLLVGTTYEADEHSLDVSPETIEMLYANAEPVLPVVRDLPLLKVQAGIRAKVGDGLLRLGQSAEMPGLYYSLSHAGAGFLRAPVIADEFSKFVLDGTIGAFTQTMNRPAR